MPRISALIAALFLSLSAAGDTGVYDDTLPPLTQGSVSGVRMSTNRAFHVNLRDSSGNELGTISNPLQCSGGGGGGGTANQGAPGPSPWPFDIANPSVLPTPPPVQVVAVPSPVTVVGSFPTPAPTPTNYALETGGNLASILLTLGSPMQQTGGSLTCNAGMNLNTSALATAANQTNGNQLSQVTNFPATYSTTNGATPADGYSVGGVYYSATPTPTPGKFYPISLDPNANVYVNVVNPLPTPPPLQVVAVPSPVTVTGTVAVTGAFPTPPPVQVVAVPSPVTVVGAFPTPYSNQNVTVTGSPTVLIGNPSVLPTPPPLQNVNVTQVNGSSYSLGQTTVANSAPVSFPTDGPFGSASASTTFTASAQSVTLATTGWGQVSLWISMAAAASNEVADIFVSYDGSTYVHDLSTCFFDMSLIDGNCYNYSAGTVFGLNTDLLRSNVGAIKSVRITSGLQSGSWTQNMTAIVTVTNGVPMVDGVAATLFAKVSQETSPWVDNVSQFGGTAVTLGQKTMTASMPVVLPSNQAAIPVTVPSPVAVTGAFPTPPATQAVTGSATTNGTAPTDSYVHDGIYFSATPTPTPGNTYPLSLDKNANLYVNVFALPSPIAVTGPFPTPPSSQAVTGSFPTPPPTYAANNGSAPTDSFGVGGIYYSATPTPTPGNFYAFSMDSHANQFVNVVNPLPTPNATQPVTVAAAAISGSHPCVNPTATLLSVSGATSGTTATQIIALSGTTKIYICSMTIVGVSGTSPTFSLVQGTGTNCAGSQTVLKHSFTTAAGTLYPFANPVAVSVAGDAVCFLDGGTTPVQDYDITYVQQ